MPPAPPDAPGEIESPAFLQKIGLKPPFTVNGPDRVSYPKAGHGYVLTVQEDAGKQRLGSARFNSKGDPTYWSLDGIVTG